MSADEVRAHLAAARNKLSVARELLERGHEQDAASRAYYAMYHAAYALVRTKGHAPKTHRGLAVILSKEFPVEVPPPVLAKLRMAQEAREAGDYDAQFSPGRDVVDSLIEDAEAFIERIRGLIE